MGKIFTELVKKHGFGLVMAAVTLYVLRSQVGSDRDKTELERVNADLADAKAKAKQKDLVDLNKNLEETPEKAKNCGLLGRYQEEADTHKAVKDAYKANPTEYKKNEMDRAKAKADKSYDELKELTESSLFEHFHSLYNSYIEFLDTLTPDKIVCVFNIIIGGLCLSSFFSVLSIMLSDNIINKIKFLDRFPKILNVLRIRSFINKKIAKLLLFWHLILILGGILSNIYMLFL